MKPIILMLLLILAASVASGYELVYAFNSGSGDAYTDVEGNLFEPDRAYVPGDAGHINGFQQQPPYIPNISPWTSLDFELHYRQNRLLEGYRFDLPSGDYLIRLYFFDGVKHGPHLRVFDVRLEGELAIEAMDICDRVGFMSAYERSFLVHVEDGTLDLDLDQIRGETTLSAVAVWSVTDPGVDPDPPADVTVDSSYGMNILHWTAEWAPLIQDVAIYRSDAMEGPYELVDSIPYNRRFRPDYDADEGDSYFYRLTTRDIWGRESVPTSPLAVTTQIFADTGLPIFRLNISSADLDSLNAWPFSNDYYDVGWAFNDDYFQQGEGHYRGGLARFFEKKSWKVKPGEADVFADLDILLMISNPDDPYVIRNHVSMRIFDELPNVWHSDIYWAALVLNDEYRGVYDLVEPVDEDFLSKRGEMTIGNLYKAYANMQTMTIPSMYRNYYEYKAGSDQSYVDLITLIEGITREDEFDIGPFFADRIDLTSFYDYYSHMVYTRQYDFIVRNYYLYHSPKTGLWSLFPWDMSLSFWPQPLALDFGTTASPHFWDGSYNKFIDRLMGVPRLRWDYAKRLEELNNQGILHGSNLDPAVWDTYNEVQDPGMVDPFRPWFATGDYFDIAGSYIDYRINQRDTQLISMMPPFLEEIPTLSINEICIDPAGLENPWVEIYNYGDEAVMTFGFVLECGADVPIPITLLEPGDYLVYEIDEGGVPGSKLNPEGGTAKLRDRLEVAYDQVRYGPAQAGFSQGHVPDGWVNWVTIAPSDSAANTMLDIPVICSAGMIPAQPLPEDSLEMSANLVKHSSPLAVTAWFSLGDSTWSAPLGTADPDSMDWYVKTDPVEQGGIMHWWMEAVDTLGMSTTLPTAAPEFYYQAVVIDGAYAIFINELMADNETVISDEAGQFEDWVEFYNAGEDTVDLAGFLLSDSFEVPNRWIFPYNDASKVPPGEYIIVWCDEDSQDGPLHASFKLDKDGEEIAFFMPDSTMVNAIEFGRQQEDVSFGRVSDADPVWVLQSEPTPLAPNTGGTSTDVAPALMPLALRAAPNPFNPVVRLSIDLPWDGPVELVIFDVRGRRVKTLLQKNMQAGSWTFEWKGIDERGGRCSSGVYLACLRSGSGMRSSKLVLLK